ncbi:MAG: peptidylprolyl isomerase [Anaerolineales bacterium]|jgi:FKBP-type peptidyl-prolyl cis-trans isomerase SlyD
MNKENNQPEVVAEDTVVSMDYTLKVDGEVIDTSEGSEPIQFIQGRGQIIPGLESELNGMAVGDSKEVVVQPGEGYGEIDEKAFANIPRKEFPSNIPLEKDVKLQLRDDEGNILDAYIENVKEKSVRLNFNHPLAGKELHFDVTVVDLRDATEEELAHGHVHELDHPH